MIKFTISFKGKPLNNVHSSICYNRQVVHTSDNPNKAMRDDSNMKDKYITMLPLCNIQNRHHSCSLMSHWVV